MLITFINLLRKVMKITIIFSFILIVLWNYCWEGQTETPKITYKYLRDGGYTLISRLRVLQVPSLSQCCGECYMEPGCTIVGYDEINYICTLHDSSFLSVSSLSETYFVIKYYQGISSSCNPTDCENPSRDYTYECSLDACVSSKRPRMTWEEAEQNCSQEGAHIMYTRTQAEFDFMKLKLKGEHSGVKLWVGGSGLGNSTFAWMSGEVINNTNGGQYWHKNKPNEFDTCIRIQTNTKGEKKYRGLNDVPCNNTHMFFCQLDDVMSQVFTLG